MQFHRISLEPDSAAFCKLGRFWNFMKPKQIDEESPHFTLRVAANWHRDLNMINPENAHLFRWIARFHPRG
jgi:hypothetical protein